MFTNFFSTIGLRRRAASSPTAAARGRPGFRGLAIAGSLLLQLLVSNVAMADATICVHDVAGLNSAIGTAAASKVQTLIQLEKGTYQESTLYAAFKSPVVFAGDYVPGTGCTQRGDSADTTIIDFGGSASDVKLTQLIASPYALIKFDRLTLRNGRSLTVRTGDFATPPYLGQGDYAGHITLVHVHVTGFTGGGENDNAAASFTVHNGNFTMIDVLFDHLGSPSSCAVSILPWDDNYIRLDHVTMALSGNRNLCLDDSTASNDKVYEIDNTIIWPTDGGTSTIRGLTSGDPNVDSNIEITFNNTLFKGYDGVAKTIANNHPVSADPLWVNPAAGNYRLQTAPKSPAINAGSAQVPGGEPATDLDGNTRVIGSAPDIGAYESPTNDADTFVVTNTNDSGTGSLRTAIDQANASSSAATQVLFAIPVPGNPNASLCPAVINLASPLPNITHAVQINGYSQPGSSSNTDLEAFNATLCVVVQPGVGFPTGVGFNVPAGVAGANARLNLYGIGIGSFYRGVQLLGGDNHQISGNQFGGLINQGTYQLSGANGKLGPTGAAIDVNMDTVPAHVFIGGDDPAYRNAIQNTQSYGMADAIFVGLSVHGTSGSCQIDGNLIGVTDDGYGTAGNDYGLMLESDGCVVHGNRFAGNSYDPIWINGGNNNVLRNNVIGLIPYGFNLGAVNYGVGIRVEGNNNVIGGSVFDADPLQYENTIEYMQGPGIVVQYGSGNTIRGNTIVYNNVGVGGDDMDIDLNYDGPTANDMSDADSGPNLGQNYPTLHSLVWDAPPQSGDTDVIAFVSGTLRTQPGPAFYQVDAYNGDYCNTLTGRGTAQSYAGGISYVYVPAGADSVNFTVPVKIPSYVKGKGSLLSVTATSNSNSEYDTSELSTCFNTDTIFRDGVENF